MTSNQIAYWRLQEDKRHNRESESINRSAVGAQYAAVAESRRANLERERLTAEAQAEIARSNVAREDETYRTNFAKEQETYRSNVARELETYRHNLAQEAETQRVNMQLQDERDRRYWLDSVATSIDSAYKIARAVSGFVVVN